MRAALVVVVLALAGCAGDGGNDGSGSTSGTGDDERLSRAEFARQATAVCDRVEQDTQAVTEPQSLAGVEQFATELRRIIDEGLADLRELQPPEELEQPYARYLQTGDDLSEQLDAMVEAAAAGDEAAVQAAAARGEQLSEAADEHARDAGIPGCED